MIKMPQDTVSLIYSDATDGVVITGIVKDNMIELVFNDWSQDPSTRMKIVVSREIISGMINSLTNLSNKVSA